MATKFDEKKAGSSSLSIFRSLLNGYKAKSIGYLASTSAAKSILLRMDKRIHRELMSKKQYPKKVQEEKYYMARNLILTILKSIENAKNAPNVQQAIIRAVTNVFLDKKNRTANFEKDYGRKPPSFLTIGPGKFCNLKCVGCYASSSAADSEKLDWDIIDRILEEKENLWGSYFTTITGGEPLLYESQGKTFLDLAKKHQDQYFVMFTNGTMIDKDMAKKLQEVGNITPAISIEGFEKETDARRGKGTHKKILEAMENLREVGVPFGISLTATHNNAEAVGAEKLYDYYFGKHGAVYAWIFQLMPIGRADSLELMVDAKQRVKLFRNIHKLAEEKKMFIADFWNNGCLTDGCISAGRHGGYLYIEWNGNVTPCVFNPYSPININDVYKNGKNLNDVLDEPFFEEIRQWQKDYALDRKPNKMGNWLLPCPIKDHYSDMRKLIDKHKPAPIDEASRQALLDENYKKGLEKYDREIAAASDPIWEKEYLEKK
jgi:MoaA/NifB/PqqE/SkfB family radical SAM enzyme